MSVEDVQVVSEEVVFSWKSWGKSNPHFSAEVKRGLIVWLNVKSGRRDALIHRDVVGLRLFLKGVNNSS